MNTNLLIVLSAFAFVNLIAFLIMLVDKIRSAKQGAERISEGMLFFLAATFGSLGIYAGMFIFHHKNRKWYFLVGIPLLFVENFAFIYILYLWPIQKLILN